MLKLKIYLKKFFPKIFSFIRYFYLYYKNNKIIKNYFRKSYKQRALLSYITEPFSNDSYKHTNFFEAKSIANILSSNKYVVDIINSEFTGTIKLNQYDVIIGSGDIFQRYYEDFDGKKIKTICYCTGMHASFQNNITLKRLLDVYNKKKVWIGKSSRYVKNTWAYQTILADGLLVLGNEICEKSFHSDNCNTYMLPTPFYKVIDGQNMLNRRDINQTKNTFLWFGGSGLIHKGLDLLLDFFSTRDDVELYICGDTNQEKGFVDAYQKELRYFKNIKTQGFIDINDKKFEDLLLKCSFVIVPSASEGGSPSVITAIGNGALIPIITRESSISTGNEIWINDLTCNAIETSVNYALSLSNDKIYEMQRSNLEYVLENHGNEIYYKKLSASINDILTKD